jgi:putative aldouronate transport system substrate-binding protein
MRKYTKLISLLSIFVLLTSVLFAGCSSNKGEPAEETASQTTVSSDPAETKAAEETANPLSIKYDPEITISTIKSYIASSPFKFEGNNKSYEDNVWIREYKEKFGINITYKWMVDESQYETKFNLMLASGDLPDVFSVSKLDDLNKLIDSGMLADLSSVYNRVPEDSILKKYVAKSTELDLKLAQRDGKLYGIPHAPTSISASPMLFIREDWLKTLNLSEPKSAKDVIEIARAFAKQDPDRNGKNDTIGLYISKDSLFGNEMVGFYNSYHAYPGIYIEDQNGQITAGSILPGVKSALSALQSLYADGTIAKDYAAIDANKLNELFSNGKIGIWYGLFYEPIVYMQKTMDNDKNAQWKVYPLPSSDDQSVSVQAKGGCQYNVVSAQCKNPEALMPLLNRTIEIRYLEDPVEGYKTEFNQKFNIDANGNEIRALMPIQFGSDWFCASGGYGSDDYIAYFNGSKTLDQTHPEVRPIIANGENYKKGDISQWMWDFIYNETGSMQIINNYSYNNQIINNKFVGALSDETQRKLAAANNTLVETVTAIIQGQPVDSYDAAVEKWKSIGGNDALKEINEWYSAYVK